MRRGLAQADFPDTTALRKFSRQTIIVCMTLDNHKCWVRTGIRLACYALAVAIGTQALLQVDFQGLPFLAFGIIVGALGASLLVRTLLAKFTVIGD